jgi:signal transduction histidine kinase
MRERLRELGGRLSMPTTQQGTVVLASIPAKRWVTRSALL